MEVEKSRYRVHGLTGSIVTHLILFLMLFFMAINMPDPPLSERGGGGIELNYGTDEAGFGENQTMEASGDNSQETEASNIQNDLNANVTSPNTSSSNDGSLTQDDPESIALNEPKEEKKNNTTTTNNNKTTNEKPKETVDNSKANNTQSTTNQQTVNPKATMTGNNNNGDQEGKTGDQGNPNGNVNAKALYGDPGKGGGTGGGDGKGDGTGKGDGASLDMAGWTWDFKPNVKDESNESGRIVFKVKINSEGEIISIIPIEKSVSPSVVKIYEKEVQKLTFTKNSGTPPPFTEGKITFIIRSN